MAHSFYKRSFERNKQKEERDKIEFKKWLTTKLYTDIIKNNISYFWYKWNKNGINHFAIMKEIDKKGTKKNGK